MRVKITKEQMTTLKSAIKPVKNTDYIKLALIDEEFAVQVDDIGFMTDVRVVPSFIELGEGEQSYFFMDRHLFNKVAGVVVEEIEFEVDREENQLTMNIDGTEVNRSLAIYDEEIDTTYGNDESEVVPSETVAEWTDRVGASGANEKLLSKTMRVGKRIEYGSKVSFTVVHKGLQKIDAYVSHYFLHYMKNISEFEGDVEFIYDNERSLLILKNGEVTYITKDLKIETPNIDEIIESSGEVASCDFSAPVCVGSLGRLSIALMGSEDHNFTVSIGESNENAIITVKDFSNKVSRDKWGMVNVKGSGLITLRTEDYLAILNVVEDEYHFSMHEEFVVISDGKQDTALMAFS